MDHGLPFADIYCDRLNVFLKQYFVAFGSHFNALITKKKNDSSFMCDNKHIV